MNYVLFDGSQLLPLWIILGLLGFFGLLILVIILVKRRFPSLQVKKDEISEEEAVQQELDRILVPIDDEEVQEQIANASNEDNK